jgi:hypothetical protein
MNRFPCSLVLLAGSLLLAPTPTRAVDPEKVNRAIEKGLAFLRAQQQPSGAWAFTAEQQGANFLAGLTLLELGYRPDDPEIRKLVRVVRPQVPRLSQTYHVACALLFLDRLGDPRDIPLIEALGVRLLETQNADGGWGYYGPAVPEALAKRLEEHVKENADRPRPEKVAPLGKRARDDLPRDLQERLALLERRPGDAARALGQDDNSNTQLAILALWRARNYGVPVDRAFARVRLRFVETQNADGGWTYRSPGASTPTMTCVGLIGLALAHAVQKEAAEARRPGMQPTPLMEIGQDPAIRKGLAALASTVGQPVGTGKEEQIPKLKEAGRAYYFLWSVERVAVGLDLKTIGGKDWYDWGAEILLRNQQPDGSWAGEFAGLGIDTCFALLFLKRANLTDDLTAHVKGKIRDEKELKPTAPLKPIIEVKSLAPDPERPRDPDKPKDPPAHPRPREGVSGRGLRDKLLKAGAAEQARLIQEYRDTKGVAYTEGLAFAIPQLPGDSKRQAREALAERLRRMNVDTLSVYLRDDDAEIRTAAALACASKQSRKLLPELVELLADQQPLVVRAARKSLQTLTGQDFGPGDVLTPQEQQRAVKAWKEWLARQPE